MWRDVEICLRYCQEWKSVKRRGRRNVRLTFTCHPSNLAHLTHSPYVDCMHFDFVMVLMLFSQSEIHEDIDVET